MDPKRSSSLQNYLDSLDKQSYSSDEDDWGFFVDMEHKSKPNAISIKKKVNVNHYHYHYHADDVNHHDRDNSTHHDKYKETDEATSLMNYGNMLVIIGLAIYLFLI